MKINIKNDIFGRVHVFLLYVCKTDARFIHSSLYFLTFVKGEADVFAGWFKIPFSFQLDLGVE